MPRQYRLSFVTEGRSLIFRRTHTCRGRPDTGIGFILFREFYPGWMGVFQMHHQKRRPVCRHGGAVIMRDGVMMVRIEKDLLPDGRAITHAPEFIVFSTTSGLYRCPYYRRDV